MNKAVLSIIVFVCGLGAGFLLRPVVMPCRDGDLADITRSDTLAVRDTAVDRRPGIADISSDSLLLLKLPALLDIPGIANMPDTVYKRDTVYVPARWVQLRYDRPDYRAWVSGYQLDGRGPQLDSVYVYPESRYITKESIFVEPRKCNNIALEASVSWCSAASLLLSVEYRHEWRRWYLGGSVGYDVITGSPYVGVTAGVPIFRW